MIDLVRAGRTPEELSREFEPSAASIAGCVRRADAEDGTWPDVLTPAEHEEPAHLRREARQLRQERDILAKDRHSNAIGSSPMDDAWFAASPNGRTS
jgi:transposase